MTSKHGARTSGKIFVAYPYRTYKKASFRRLFKALEAEYSVTFIFADEEIKNIHIMAKIESYIEGADFSLFDITGWNPNVTLELGLAQGLGRDFYILFNPTKGQQKDAPSDLRGIDRLEWKDYETLKAKLSTILNSRYSRTRDVTIDKQLENYRAKTVDLLEESPDLNMSEIAQALDIDVAIAQLVMQPMVQSGKVVFTGDRRGRKYFLKSKKKGK